MNLYPAIEAKMGIWKYYIVKMKMRELANDVQYAAEVYDERTLDEAIQRVLNEGRVKKEIVTFLKYRPDRFFASVVVASLGGNPLFYPVRITDDEKFSVFKDQKIDEPFGVLSFSGDQKYYALDGQHRLKAIKTLLDHSDPDSKDAPEGFSEEEISVLMIVRSEEKDAAFLQSYRRLFSSLNRYAKATDIDTNIIMDEDDAFAILTRRIINDHEFFRWGGKQKESPRILTKGKNLRSTDPHFTSLQTLYAMNRILLTANWRGAVGWVAGEGEMVKDVNMFMRFRPTEEYLDHLNNELVLYWDAILEAIPDLRKEAIKMRIHDIDPDSEDGLNDHLLFWPIGQELFAQVARRLLDKRLPDPKKPTKDDIINVLKRLGKVDWCLHNPPWRHLLLTQVLPHDNKWRMRSEDRKEVLVIADRILTWLIGLDELTKDDIEELKLDWRTRLIPAQESDYEDQMWELIQKKRSEIVGASH